jgi:hypothetical protein
MKVQRKRRTMWCNVVKYAVTVLQSCSRRGSVSSSRYADGDGVRHNEERVMKSRVINSVRARASWLPRVFLRLPRRVVAAGSVLCVVTLSGCYYPYGYYPSGYYPAYYSPYSTAPATAVQQGVPAGQTGSTDAQQQQQQNAAPAYAVAPPPVYVAPAYPAYYPPPVYPAYPAYYGYPGYYGPSVSIGIGGYWGGGWGHHWHH